MLTATTQEVTDRYVSLDGKIRVLRDSELIAYYRDRRTAPEAVFVGRLRKKAIRETIKLNSDRGIFGLNHINDWQNKLAIYRKMIAQKVADPSDMTWRQKFDRTLKSIRQMRRDMWATLPGASQPYPFRVDASTKYVPHDDMDHTKNNLGRAIEGGYLPHRVTLMCDWSGSEYLRDIIAYKIKPKHPWGICRPQDDLVDRDSNIIRETVVYFSSEESTDMVRQIWHQYELDRVKRQLRDLPPRRISIAA